MRCYMAEFQGELKASSEIDRIVWLTTNNMEEISPVDKLIFKDLKEKGLLD